VVKKGSDWNVISGGVADPDGVIEGFMRCAFTREQAAEEASQSFSITRSTSGTGKQQRKLKISYFLRITNGKM